MGKPFAVVALIVSAFCISSVLGLAPSAEHFFVEGKIYCDPCRLEFETRLSHPLSGVKVTLECKKPDTGSLTYSSESYTDANGIYSVPVKGDHEDEICEVKTGNSTDAECNELMAGRNSDKVVLTKNMGATNLVRYVNPLGFKKQAINALCADVVKELGLDNLDD